MVLQEVVYSARNRGSPLSQNSQQYLEALAALAKAQPVLAALEAASRRTDAHGEALSVAAVAKNVDAAVSKLAENDSRLRDVKGRESWDAVWIEAEQVMEEGILLSRHQTNDHSTARLREPLNGVSPSDL
ncbi:hypothetical protein N2152v2_000560 [Parachlorella kessleri]